MAGKDNLKTPSAEEARERGRKGGIASGEARRKKQQLRAAIQSIFDGTYHDEKGCERSAEEIFANRILKVALDTSHPKWFDVLQLLIKLTDSDIDETELELKEAQLHAQLNNIRNTPQIDWLSALRLIEKSDEE